MGLRRGLVLPVLLLAGVAAVRAQGASYYKPGWNLYSPQQDVQIGQQAAAQMAKQLPMLHNAAAGRYLTGLGDKLAAQMPGPKFPYNFHLVNQKEINAFALPGGPVFVNVGAVCAAKNEAQLAGVVGHEESHVALRHSTSMASKKDIVSVPLGILGGIFNSGAGQLATVGAQMVAGSVFLKYSRDMESQADALGAQVMNAAGYDPRAMAQFFETLEAQGGSQTVQFLSDHPNPGNRRAAIEKEIPTLGPHPSYQDDSAAFEQTRAELCGASGARQDAATPRAIRFQDVSLAAPAGWSAYGDQTSQLTLVPPGGLGSAGGQTQVLRGVIVSTTSGTEEQLVTALQQANPQLRPLAGTRTAAAAGGMRGSALTLTNRNFEGQEETDRLVLLARPGAHALYFIFIAPSHQYDQLSPAFDGILKSLKR